MTSELNLFFTFVSAFAMGLLSLGLFSNLRRGAKVFEFPLQPNCLLTRYPVVFLTGPRSIFYFRKYWNAFPVYLAEHGYEVFTVHLPWKGPARKQKLREFLAEQERTEKVFHFVVDAATSVELAEVLHASPAVLSQTIPPASAGNLRAGIFSELSFFLHRYARFNSTSIAPTLSELGANFPANTEWLLARMKELGEQDFLR